MTYKFKDDMSYSVCFEAGKVIGETKIHLRFEEEENQTIIKTAHMDDSLFMVQRLFKEIQDMKKELIEAFEEGSLFSIGNIYLTLEIAFF